MTLLHKKVLPILAFSLFTFSTINAQQGTATTITTDANLAQKPCKPLIGVQLNVKKPANRGIAIERVLPNTPATVANLEAGDIIINFDGFDVNSPCELIAEKDQYYPGDEFSMTYIRNGESITVDAIFPTCEELGMPEVALPSTHLVLSDFQAYPNPTDGLTTIYFEGKAEAITVQVTDLFGREVFREDLSTFDGQYNQRIDLSSRAAGTYLVNIRQGQQFFTDKIILKKD